MARAFWRGMGRRDAPRFDNWETQFEEMSLLIGDQPLIIIFDEFPYAVESDPRIVQKLHLSPSTREDERLTCLHAKLC